MKQSVKKRGRLPKVYPLAKSPHLHLSHRRHTGKLLPHHSTSYPTLGMILLCLGVLLSGWTHVVSANEYVVHASVLGSAPTVAATITLPVDGSHVTATPLNVVGSCPTDSYVSLYRNGLFSGVALCDAGGAYRLATDLFVGANQLQARVFSRTDLPGPVVAATTVYYDPPAGPATNHGVPIGSNGRASPKLSADAAVLVLKSNFSYQGFYAGQPVRYQVLIEGGLAPYAIAVDWGDGQQSLISRSAAGNFELMHTYQKAGGYQGSYPIKILATDAVGQRTNLQLLTIVNSPPNAAAGQLMATGIGGKGAIQRALHYLWPSYGVTVLLVTAFWLGERHEFAHLRPPRRVHHG
jgi:hypothetical protein